MKKIVLLITILFIYCYINLYSQNSLKSPATIDKIAENNFNKSYIDKYCINFYYNNELYVLSYESDNNPTHIKERAIFLFKYNKSDWQYASDFIFISTLSYNYSLDFLDYPKTYNAGNAIVKVLDNKCVLVSMSYRETIFNKNYNYPIILLLIPTYNNQFNSVLFSPNRSNNRYGISIIDNNTIIMNDKSKVNIKFNNLNNITFTDELGNYLIYNK